MSTIGLARGTVRLNDYDSSWPGLFDTEARQLLLALRVAPEHIQHVGSTAIPGMLAKPIIDIAILVDTVAIAEKWEPVLKDLGYWYKGVQPDMPGRRFFAKGPEARRTVYLHVVNHPEFQKLITFRDALRKDQRLAQRYAALKQRLANVNANDRANYSKLKSTFIQEVLRKGDS